MLTETQEIDRIEVVGSYAVQVRTACRVQRDGVEIAVTYHRHVVAPDSDLSAEDPRVQAVAAAVFTEEVKAAWAEVNGA